MCYMTILGGVYIRNNRKEAPKRPQKGQIENALGGHRLDEQSVSGPQKAPAERGHVTKRQKVSKIIFDTFRHFSCRAKKIRNCQKYFSTLFVTPDLPQSEIAATNFMTQAEVWAKNRAKFSVYFRASFAVQNDPQIFSQNSSQFVTPCLVAEIFKFYLPELGFGPQLWGPQLFDNFCAAPIFWPFLGGSESGSSLNGQHYLNPSAPWRGVWLAPLEDVDFVDMGSERDRLFHDHPGTRSTFSAQCREDGIAWGHAGSGTKKQPKE